MAKHGRSETVKWVAVALLLFNLLVLEATWFRKREDGRQKDFVLKLAHANEACITQRADASRIAKSECPPVECTQADIKEFKTQVSKAQAELKVVKTAAESAATSAKQQLKSQSSRIKELEGNSQQQSRNRVLIEKNTEQRYTLSNPQVKTGSVLLLTPAKNAVPQLEQYFSNLKTLTYPRHLTSLGFIVSDSLDYCSREIRKHVKVLDGETYASVIVLQRDYGYAQAPDPDKVPTPDDEVYRRQILARSRNYLLSYALRNQEWVLWLDVDIVYTPPSLVEDLLSYKKMILTTDCIFLDAEGNPTDAHCDGNSWAESDASRKYLKTVDPKKPLFLDYGGDTAFRNTRIRLSAIVGGAKDQPVPLDGVGGSVLLVKADLHREGLIFPSSLVEHQIETEGFAQLCKAIGHQPFGLPDYTVHHAKVTVKPVPVWD